MLMHHDSSSFLLQFQQPSPSVRPLERVVVVLLEELQLHRDLLGRELSVENCLHLCRQFGAGKPATVVISVVG